MSNQSGKIVLILILLLLVLGASSYFFLPVLKNKESVESVVPYSPAPASSTYKESSSVAEVKDYYSKTLKISFQVPEDAMIEEKFTSINISLDSGTVSVDFNGTNFNNSQEHYKNLKEKNRLTPLSYQEGKIKNYDYVLTTDESIQNKEQTDKAYSIYADYGIYIFSTSDEALYPVLDQIVQSFEYKP